VTVALRSHLDVVMAALERSGIERVYRGMGPVDPLGSVPYVVVHSGSAVMSGPVSELHADVDAEVQVTAVGAASEQAEWMNDGVLAALLGHPVSPPAGRAWLQPIAHVLTRPVERDIDFGEGAPMFYVVSIFSLQSTPA
jgi:hypothetical protein